MFQEQATHTGLPGYSIETAETFPGKFTVRALKGDDMLMTSARAANAAAAIELCLPVLRQQAGLDEPEALAFLKRALAD